MYLKSSCYSRSIENCRDACNNRSVAHVRARHRAQPVCSVPFLQGSGGLVGAQSQRQLAFSVRVLRDNQMHVILITAILIVPFSGIKILSRNTFLLLSAVLAIFTGTAVGRDDGTIIKRDVCIGGLERYRHGSDSWMRVWQDVSGREITADCAFNKNTVAGKAVMHVCGRILDVVGKELRHACRIDGLFRVYGGKVRMELLRTYNVRLISTITCFGTLKEYNQDYVKLDRTCLVSRKDLGPCSIGKRCRLVGTFTKVKRDYLGYYLIDRVVEIEELEND
jgi:hypothetical protein